MCFICSINYGKVMVMMSTKHSQQHPCLEHHALLERLCRPLKSLGVEFFGYTAVDLEGRAYCLGSKPDYAAEYLKQNHAQNDVHHRTDNIDKQKRYHFWDYAQLDKNAEALYQMASKFDQGHTLTITRTTPELTRCYHFSGRLADSSLNQRYLEKMDCLHAFMDYFDDCLNEMPEVAAIYQHPVILQTSEQKEAQPPTPVGCDPRTVDLAAHAQNPLCFKRSKRYYLTRPERRCLYWLHRGKSSEMIAQIQGVSRKTIERHIASIKEKFGCYTLFQLGQKIAEMGLTEFLAKPINRDD